MRRLRNAGQTTTTRDDFRGLVGANTWCMPGDFPQRFPASSRLLPNTIGLFATVLLHTVAISMALLFRGAHGNAEGGKGSVVRYISLVSVSAPKKQSIISPSWGEVTPPEISPSVAGESDTDAPRILVQRDQSDSRSRDLTLDTSRVPDAVLKWRTAIREAVRSAWIKPESGRVASTCRLVLVQDNRGSVMGVSLEACEEDNQIHESLVAAVYHASPLPPYPGTRGIDPVEVRLSE